jgi:hypothetical protein
LYFELSVPISFCSAFIWLIIPGVKGDPDLAKMEADKVLKQGEALAEMFSS